MFKNMRTCIDSHGISFKKKEEEENNSSNNLVGGVMNRCVLLKKW